MTTFSIICMLFILSFFAGIADVWTYVLLGVAAFYIIGFAGGMIQCVAELLGYNGDFFNTTKKTPNGFVDREERKKSFMESLKAKSDNGDIEAKRKLIWLNLSDDERWIISETYKSLKRDNLNKALQSCNDKIRCSEIQEEIDNLDWTYNRSRPPKEWITKNNL